MSNRVGTPVHSPIHQALPEAGVAIDERGARTLARTLYRTLRARGLDPRHLLQVTTELMSLLSDELSKTDGAGERR